MVTRWPAPAERRPPAPLRLLRSRCNSAVLELPALRSADVPLFARSLRVPLLSDAARVAWPGVKFGCMSQVPSSTASFSRPGVGSALGVGEQTWLCVLTGTLLCRNGASSILMVPASAAYLFGWRTPILPGAPAGVSSVRLHLSCFAHDVHSQASASAAAPGCQVVLLESLEVPWACLVPLVGGGSKGGTRHLCALLLDICQRCRLLVPVRDVGPTTAAEGCHPDEACAQGLCVLFQHLSADEPSGWPACRRDS